MISVGNIFPNMEEVRGNKWMCGIVLYTGFHSILGRNAELGIHGNQHEEAIVSTSIRHQVGTHVLMGDGATNESNGRGGVSKERPDEPE